MSNKKVYVVRERRFNKYNGSLDVFIERVFSSKKKAIRFIEDCLLGLSGCYPNGYRGNEYEFDTKDVLIITYVIDKYSLL